jgi:GntR family transcriptional regulator of vanillate catabolism
VAEPALKADERSGSQTLRAQLALRDLVLSGQIKPGERLSELAIVERIGVSRTPVRAALMMLAEEGLVESVPSGGFAVRAFSDGEVLEAIEIRGTVEGLAVRLAAERGVPSTALTPLRDLLSRLDAVVAAAPHEPAAFEDYVDLNARFHREIVALAESRLVERQLERVMTLPFASPSAFVMAQSQMPEALQILLIAQDQHHCIVEAIASREGARAETVTREHSRLAGRNLALALRSKRTFDLVPGSALIRLRGR